MTPITITYRIEFEDYEKAQSLVHNPKRFGRIAVAVMIVGAVLGLLGKALEEPRKDDWSLAGLALFFGIGVAFMALMFLVFTPWVHRRNLRRLYDQQKAFQDPVTAVLSEDSLQTRTASSESRTPWERFHKWRSTDEMVLVFESDALMHIYPRRAFASQQDYDAVRELLTRRLGPAK